MARREQDNVISTFAELKELKNIDNSTMLSILEEAFRNVIAKTYGSDANYDFILNPEKGDVEIWRNRKIVADDNVTDDNTQISLSEAHKIADDYEIGEEISEKVDIASFGRRTVLNLSQILSSKIFEIQKDTLYAKYSELVGQIVTGEVYQVWKKEILLLDDQGNELLLPKQDQIPTDFYRKGEIVRAVVVKVDNRNNNPKIYISRTAPLFLERLFEAEVPEIHDGLITIKKVVRVPGERAKIAVESYDERIDPVGACVGVKGGRIHSIVRELNNENIDVINYTTNPNLFIARALNPAKITALEIDNEEKKAIVYINPEEISLAIGKNGNNIKLAIQLTGYHIEVMRENAVSDEEDILLSEFSDEIEEWIIDIIRNSTGCDTAKQVLRISREDLLERTDLEEETVDDVLRILSAEFEFEENEQEKPEIEPEPEIEQETEQKPEPEIEIEQEQETETETEPTEETEAKAEN
ncbi:MAG: transcription termination factor NusA [Prevotellaceae bacterium]|jgi:N utilization substance protein A|nr:transcription termination factor NusA [Prevotellaceae bacterium]